MDLTYDSSTELVQDQTRPERIGDLPRLAWGLIMIFGRVMVLDSTGDTIVALNNLQMKTGDRITTYNIEFIRYTSQLG